MGNKEKERGIGHLLREKFNKTDIFQAPTTAELLREEQGSILLDFALKTLFLSGGLAVMILGARILNDGIATNYTPDLVVGTILTISGLSVSLGTAYLGRLNRS